MMPATAIALAWNLLDQDGSEIVWKNGSVGGFRAFIGYDAAARTGVVVLANAQTGTGGDDIGLHILDPKLPVDLHIPRRHVEVKIDPALLDRYVGTYKYADNDFVVVTREGDHLAESENGRGQARTLRGRRARFLLQGRRRTDHLRDRTGRQDHCRHLAPGRTRPARGAGALDLCGPNSTLTPIFAIFGS